VKKKNCVFCHLKDKDVIIHEDSLCFAAISKDPINKHHVLVIPKVHYKTFADLPDRLASHLFLVGKKLSAAVRKACAPDAITHIFDDDFSNNGYNLVDHYKFHIIPRFKKDLHLIDWSKLRTAENDKARSKYAKDIKKLL
jgi:histidine triad (HIT) family protein